MLSIKLLVVFFLSSLFFDGLYAVLGFLLVRTNRFHRAGVRMLAMSCFVPGRAVARYCRLDCASCRCGNWTCANYAHSPN